VNIFHIPIADPKCHFSTGLHAYSDSVGTVKKCHCKRGPTYNDTFYIKKWFGNCQNCHCNRGLTLTGVTVSGEACTLDLSPCDNYRLMTCFWSCPELVTISDNQCSDLRSAAHYS